MLSPKHFMKTYIVNFSHLTHVAVTYNINIKLLQLRLCEVSYNKGFYQRSIFVFDNSFGIKNTQRSS